ncbi:hypothetical protein Hanom_Chr13g01212311 [Helianthus anomalus]
MAQCWFVFCCYLFLQGILIGHDPMPGGHDPIPKLLFLLFCCFECGWGFDRSCQSFFFVFVLVFAVNLFLLFV